MICVEIDLKVSLQGRICHFKSLNKLAFSSWKNKIQLTIFKRFSSGSSGRERGRGEVHEIYVTAFGAHLFFDLFLHGRGGGHGPSAPTASATEIIIVKLTLVFVN